MLLPVTSDLNVTCENQRLGQKQNFPHIAIQIHTFVANCPAATVLDGGRRGYDEQDRNNNSGCDDPWYSYICWTSSF